MYSHFYSTTKCKCFLAGLPLLLHYHGDTVKSHPLFSSHHACLTQWHRGSLASCSENVPSRTTHCAPVGYNLQKNPEMSFFPVWLWAWWRGKEFRWAGRWSCAAKTQCCNRQRQEKETDPPPQPNKRPDPVKTHPQDSVLKEALDVTSSCLVQQQPVQIPDVPTCKGYQKIHGNMTTSIVSKQVVRAVGNIINLS